MHNNLGNSYRDAGDLNSAREHLEKARTMMELVHGEEKVEEMAKVRDNRVKFKVAFSLFSDINQSARSDHD